MIHTNKSAQPIRFASNQHQTGDRKSSMGKYLATGAAGGVIGAGTSYKMSSVKGDKFLKEVGDVIKKENFAKTLGITKAGNSTTLEIVENTAAKPEATNIFKKAYLKLFPQKQMEFRLGDKKAKDALNKGLSHMLGDVQQAAKLTVTNKTAVQKSHGIGGMFNWVKNIFNKSAPKTEQIFEVAGKSNANPIKLNKHAWAYSGTGAVTGVGAGLLITGLAALKKSKSEN